MCFLGRDPQPQLLTKTPRRTESCDAANQLHRFRWTGLIFQDTLAHIGELLQLRMPELTEAWGDLWDSLGLGNKILIVLIGGRLFAGSGCFLGLVPERGPATNTHTHTPTHPPTHARTLHARTHKRTKYKGTTKEWAPTGIPPPQFSRHSLFNKWIELHKC